MGMTAFLMLANSTTAYVSSISQSKPAKGTEKLIGDAAIWLMVLVPVVPYTLFMGTILPTLTQKITSLFNYQG